VRTRRARAGSFGNAGWNLPVEIGREEKHQRLVQRHPEANAIAEDFDDAPGELGEALHRLRRGPWRALMKPERMRVVEQGDDRFDVDADQVVNEASVAIEGAVT